MFGDNRADVHPTLADSVFVNPNVFASQKRDAVGQLGSDCVSFQIDSVCKFRPGAAERKEIA
jgi:hypothetical protein